MADGFVAPARRMMFNLDNPSFDDLTGQGFMRDKNGRYVRQFERMQVFIDFLTEHPTTTSGTVSVDGVPAGVFPGIDRALATRRNVTITGTDLFGAAQKLDVPVSGIGPLLVLKLNAFDDRQQPKDAYDVLLAVTRYVDGTEAAITAFRAEARASNRGFERAAGALGKHFLVTGQSGPVRCAAFALEGQRGMDDFQARHRQILEQMVTVGHALLDLTSESWGY